MNPSAFQTGFLTRLIRFGNIQMSLSYYLLKEARGTHNVDFIVLVLASLLPTLVMQSTFAQNQSAITATFAYGEVVEIKQDAGQILIKTKEGNVTALFDGQTEFRRVAPGAESLGAAEPIKLTDISIGDILMARGKVSDDKKSVIARQLIIMNKTAIAEKQTRDREQWRANSFAGRVTSVNYQSREVVLSLRTATGEQPVTINVPDGAVVRRYAANSVRFSDAVPITLQDIKTGDQLRVLGEKNGTGFVARQVVSGSFRILGGPIVQVNPEHSEIVINDVVTKKPVTVEIKNQSTLRNVPPDLVASLAQKKTQNAGNSAAQSNTDLIEIFDTLPPITISELKTGRMLLISSTTTTDPSRVTAVLLAAGLDPLFSRPQAPGQRGIVGAVGLPNGVFDGFIGNP